MHPLKPEIGHNIKRGHVAIGRPAHPAPSQKYDIQEKGVVPYLLDNTLFVCEDLEEIGLETPPEDRVPLEIRSGKRIGIDYAEEAADFLWRYYL